MTDQTEKQKQEAAIKCVLSTAAHLCLNIAADDDEQVWREVLKEALERVKDCPPVARNLFGAAYDFAYAARGAPKEKAWATFRFETRLYFRASSANSLERLRNLMASEVVV